MRRLVTTIICAVLASAASASITGWHRLPSPLGDARMAVQGTGEGITQVWANVILPAGTHQALTVTFWTRLKTPHAFSMPSTMMTWCPDAIQYSNPDLLAGVGGYGTGGTNLTAAGGSVTVASFPFAPYAEHPDTATAFPRGVYTIAGSSASAITVTLGGEDISLGPGVFNRNARPGPANSVIISGAGVAEVGISRTPCHRFYQEIDGVKDENKAGLFTSESVITNELAMVTYRLRCTPAGQIYQSNLGRLAAFDMLSQVRTNAPCFGLSSRGIYRVGMMGPIMAPPYEWDVFDARVWTRWLTDADLERVHLNGVEEINRRGIPQWR